MAYTTVDDPEAYHQSLNYTGTAGSASRTWAGSTNMQPDWLWFKNRGGNGWNILDSTRGVTKYLSFSSAAAQSTWSGFLTSFDSDGFSHGTGDTATNSSGSSYMAFGFKANGGTTSSNTDGSITSTVQANTTAGFSIVTYTGTGSAATIGHGLGTKPTMLLWRMYSDSSDWRMFHEELDETEPQDYLLSTGNAYGHYGREDNTSWNDTAPTNTVFSINSNLSQNTQSNIVYCFTDIQGYSKFGWYQGRGNDDGTFIYTGFKPTTVFTKETDGAGDWCLTCDKMVSAAGTMGNPTDRALEFNQSRYEDQLFNIDLVSNGFKIRKNHASSNDADKIYVYGAWAKEPFVNSNGVPATAQ